MAITVKRLMPDATFSESTTEYRLTEVYIIEGDPGDDAEYPAIAKDAAGLPVYLDVHPEFAGTYVVSRDISNYGPTSCKATVVYSDNWWSTLVTDGASVLSLDMMGKTVRRYVGIDGVTGIGQIRGDEGALPEGAEVYVPNLRISYEHRQSTVDINIYLLTGYLNNAIYKGFAARTLLFLGASARKERGAWVVTYQFLYDPFEHRAYWQVFAGEIVGGGYETTPGALQSTAIYNEGNFSLFPI